MASNKKKQRGETTMGLTGSGHGTGGGKVRRGADARGVADKGGSVGLF